MTQEEKQLLLKDLCGRLSFHKTICKIGEYSDYVLRGINLSNESYPLIIELEKDRFPVCLEDVKPYLRPMSSMTEEEMEKCRIERGRDLAGECGCESDYLNSIHIDYRSLIEKGLALEALEGMYKEN